MLYIVPPFYIAKKSFCETVKYTNSGHYKNKAISKRPKANFIQFLMVISN